MDGAADTSALAPPGCWLILADQGGVGAALAQQLAGYGQTCRFIYAGASSDLVNGLSWNVDPAESGRIASGLPRCVGISGIAAAGCRVSLGSGRRLCG